MYGLLSRTLKSRAPGMAPGKQNHRISSLCFNQYLGFRGFIWRALLFWGFWGWGGGAVGGFFKAYFPHSSLLKKNNF